MADTDPTPPPKEVVTTRSPTPTEVSKGDIAADSLAEQTDTEQKADEVDQAGGRFQTYIQ